MSDLFLQQFVQCGQRITRMCGVVLIEAKQGLLERFA